MSELRMKFFAVIAFVFSCFFINENAFSYNQEDFDFLVKSSQLVEQLDTTDLQSKESKALLKELKNLKKHRSQNLDLSSLKLSDFTLSLEKLHTIKDLKLKDKLLSYINLEGTNFENSTFNNVTFISANLKNANLNNISFECSQFISCTISGILSGNINTSGFHNCVLRDLEFINTHFNNTEFYDINFDNVDFNNIDASNCTYILCTFPGNALTEVDYTQCHFTQSFFANDCYISHCTDCIFYIPAQIIQSTIGTHRPNFMYANDFENNNRLETIKKDDLTEIRANHRKSINATSSRSPSPSSASSKSSSSSCSPVDSDDDDTHSFMTLSPSPKLIRKLNITTHINKMENKSETLKKGLISSLNAEISLYRHLLTILESDYVERLASAKYKRTPRALLTKKTLDQTIDAVTESFEALTKKVVDHVERGYNACENQNAEDLRWAKCKFAEELGYLRGPAVVGPKAFLNGILQQTQFLSKPKTYQEDIAKLNTEIEIYNTISRHYQQDLAKDKMQNIYDLFDQKMNAPIPASVEDIAKSFEPIEADENIVSVRPTTFEPQSPTRTRLKEMKKVTAILQESNENLVNLRSTPTVPRTQTQRKTEKSKSFKTLLEFHEQKSQQNL